MPAISVIPGDGIGPSIVEAARRVPDAVVDDLDWDESRPEMRPTGPPAIPSPPETLKSIHTSHAALKGPCTTHVGIGFRSINVARRGVIR